jgi:hypothetical protein
MYKKAFTLLPVHIYFIMTTIKLFFSGIRRIIYASLIILGATPLSYGQVFWCKDPLANNYNASATVNSGSCTYNNTSFTPIIKVDPISDTLLESSGLQ